MRNAVEAVVRPVMEADGGGIEVVGLARDTLTVRLTAACSGCPGAPYTLEGVIRPVVETELGRPLEIALVRTPTVGR